MGFFSAWENVFVFITFLVTLLLAATLLYFYFMKYKEPPFSTISSEWILVTIIGN